MNSDSLGVEELIPRPLSRVQFAWSQFKQAPEFSGCYVLTNFTGKVLYVGQATSSIRDRFCNHLDTPEKRANTPIGKAYWFYFLAVVPGQVSAVERGWMNQVILRTGVRPIFNKNDAPV